MKKEKILIAGALGQVGTDLTFELRKMYGEDAVIASDLRDNVSNAGLYEQLDILDKKRLGEIVDKHQITQIYHLVAILSAKGEQNPQLAWDINMASLFNVLDLAKEKNIKVYWPSSIAVFGPSTPVNNTPQNCVMDPNTVYGISKQAGERWCEYYHQKYNVDVRSLRYPGLIGYKSLPGGGTTDYAVDIYHHALKTASYECFLKEDTYLPMMYMPDAIKATIDLMHADEDKIKIRSSYNVGAIDFSPKEITTSIQKIIPEFNISYNPDFRQAIADSWPNSIDDTRAREDWGWSNDYNLDKMTEDMLVHLKEMYQEKV